MGGHLGEGGVDVGLVPVRRGHRRAQVVADDDRRAAAQRLKAVDVRGHPVLKLLGGERLGIQVAGGAQHRDEQPGLQSDLAGRRIVHRESVAGEIDEQLLPGRMGLAHAHVDAVAPGPVQVRELGVAVPVAGVSFPVLHPQQLQRHALLPHVGVHLLPVRRRPVRARRQHRRIQQRLQPGVVQITGQRPLHTRRRRPDQIVVHRGLRHARRGADQALAQLLAQSQPENFTDLAHVDAGSRHRSLISDSGAISEKASQRP